MCSLSLIHEANEITEATKRISFSSGRASKINTTTEWYISSSKITTVQQALSASSRNTKTQTQETNLGSGTTCGCGVAKPALAQS